MNVVEILICNICIFLVIKMIRENKPTLWIVIGMLAGIGLLNKHTFIIYVASIVVGLLLTKERRFLFTVWFPAGLLIAFSIFLPNLIWQAANGWPSLAFYMNAHGKPDQSTLFNFTVNLIYIFNPVLFPFWLSGIIYLFFKNQGCCFRVFGWASVFLLLLLFVMREGRFDRALSIFPIILSSGMILLERLSTKKSFLFLRPIIAALVVLSGLYYVPIIMPVLRPEAAAKYLDKFGYKFVGFVGAGGRLAYPLAAKTGWEELVRRIADIYRSLPENEKKNTGIFGPLFGYPGAVDLLGGKYGLPMAISGHSSYYYWGIEECRNYDVVIVVLGSVFDGYFSRFFFEDFAEVDRLGPFYNDYWPDFLRSNSIYVFKQPNVQFKTVWEKYKL